MHCGNRLCRPAYSHPPLPCSRTSFFGGSNPRSKIQIQKKPATRAGFFVSGRDERIVLDIATQCSFHCAHRPVADRRSSARLSLVVEPPSSEVQILVPKFRYKKKPTTRAGFFVSGRDERIRTSDFLHPMQALYQTELRPEIFAISTTIFLLCNKFL